jgi:hypothetical protein
MPPRSGAKMHVAQIDGMDDDIQNSIAAGFSRHIPKPVNWQELKLRFQK